MLRGAPPVVVQPIIRVLDERGKEDQTVDTSFA
jgi:hypothetical protein